MSQRGARVLLAMAGDVDSSVTAALLKSQGFEVVGAYFQLWDPATPGTRFSSRCCASLDPAPARKICETLDIPLEIIDAKALFMERVVDSFVHDFLGQRLPNPCIPCNIDVRFASLLQSAPTYNCEFIATGHYAQVIQNQMTGQARLLRAVDRVKDQSYFLYRLDQATLRKLMMPLGGLSKQMILRMAEQFGVGSARGKSDRQPVCFVDAPDARKFVEERSASSFRPPGAIMLAEGAQQLIGRHEGMHSYRIGQREGAVDARAPVEDARFVVGFDRDAATVLIGPEAALLKKGFLANQAHWTQAIDGFREKRLKARLAPDLEPAACTVIQFENRSVQVHFDEPQRAISAGQAVVFYDEDEVLGGAVIERSIAP